MLLLSLLFVFAVAGSLAEVYNLQLAPRATTCTKNNCYRAVAVTSSAHQRSADCSSYLLFTSSPCPTTSTLVVSTTTTATFNSTTTKTTTITKTKTATSKAPSPGTSTVFSTAGTITTVSATILVIPYTDTTYTTTTVTRATEHYSISSCPSFETPTSLPGYAASSCTFGTLQDPGAYSMACKCIGVSARIITSPQITITSTRTSTVVITPIVTRAVTATQSTTTTLPAASSTPGPNSRTVTSQVTFTSLSISISTSSSLVYAASTVEATSVLPASPTDVIGPIILTDGFGQLGYNRTTFEVDEISSVSPSDGLIQLSVDIDINKNMFVDKSEPKRFLSWNGTSNTPLYVFSDPLPTGYGKITCNATRSEDLDLQLDCKGADGANFFSRCRFNGKVQFYLGRMEDFLGFSQCSYASL